MSTVHRSVVKHFRSILDLTPAVRNGDVAAIHDARVATRRLRAVLPLLADHRETQRWNDAQDTLKRAGRAFGRARDVDVALDLLRTIEERSPVAAPAASMMRARLARKQVKRRRKLIKRLESLDLSSWSESGLLNGTGWRVIPWAHPRWSRRLTTAIRDQARDLRAAIDHATGVYFPKRAHAARVAIKRLRYSVELLDRSQPERRPSLRALRRAQDALGSVHDREVLRKRLARLMEDQDVQNANVLDDLLEAESRSSFAQYLELREGVLDTCDRLAAWSAKQIAPRAAGRLLAAGALALPPAAVVLVATRVRRT